MQQRKVKQRTIQQNRALHLYFQMIASALNDAGYDMRRTLREDIDIPWTADNVKNFLWRPIQKAQLGKTSTTELTTKQIDEVYDTLNKYLGENLGITEEFPSIEQIIYGSKNQKT